MHPPARPVVDASPPVTRVERLLAGTGGRIRSFHVYDARGEVLGSFDDWDAAHAWAHEHAGVAGARVPLEAEDRSNRVTRLVWGARCEFVAWETIAHLPHACDRQG
jgi:hypothetical protein